MKKTGKTGAASASKVEAATASRELAQLNQAQALAVAMPFNMGKALEIGRENAISPPRGATPAVDGPAASASTLSEANASAKS